MLTKKELLQRANILDNIIGFFSPKARLNRLRYKYAANVFQRKYEGASQGRRTEGWHTTSNDANTELVRAATILRNRSRDLVRNNPYASRGLQAIQSNVVGKGIRGQIKVDGKSAKNREKQLNRIWNAWIMNPGVIDFGGELNFFGLQNLAMRSTVETGEVFTRLRRVKRQFARDLAGRMVEVPPIQLQLLEGDFLDTGRLVDFSTDGKTRVIQGIEFDTETGKRIAYNLFRSHPGSLDSIPTDRFRTERIPAEFISHLYRKDRAGQVRGVPWLANVLIRLRDFDEYEDAQLVRQKIAAMFTAFVEDNDGLDESTTEDCVLGETMEPGTIEVLPPGKKITLSNPPTVENYGEYSSVMLHSVATGLGISYESLTGDLSQVNFSSARMGWIEMGRNINSWRSCMFSPVFLDRVAEWFMQGVELLGIKTDGARIIWTPPKREMVDPTKEVPATIKAIRGGIMTLSESIRESGHDPETFLAEYAADNKRIDELQLILDSDARKTAQAGAFQVEEPDDPPPAKKKT